jgi:hypothetical protein
LGRAQLESTDDEADFGLSGLVEGNARRIEKAYVESLPLSEQLQAMREQSSVLSQHPEVFDLPPVLLTLAQAPYEDGVLFVQDLLDDGGQAELDKAFGAPPITSEQIFDSKRFIAGEGPVAVPAPMADGTAANTGVLGERLLREAFFDSLPSVAEVERAISGWGGDAYVTWTDAAGKTCLRDTFVGDTPADTHELVQAITEWSADHAAIIDAPADGPATFTVCA